MNQLRAAGASFFRQLLSAVVLIWLVLSLTFVLLHAAPGHPSDRFEDPRIPAQHRTDLQQRYGFDRTLFEQYFRYLAATSSGHLGYSHHYARPVVEVLGQRLPNSLLLGGSALLVATFFGLGLGLTTALIGASFTTRFASALTTNLIRGAEALVFALPTFWLSLMTILVFSYLLGWFPSTGLHSVTAQNLGPVSRFFDLLHHLVLPALVLAAPLAVQVARFLTSALVESQTEDFIVAARARGLSERRLLFLHALRPSLGPIVQLLGVAVPTLLAGTFIVEVVFAWPGLGMALVEGVSGRDYSLVLAITLLTAALVIVSGVLANSFQRILDPRMLP